MEKQQVNFFKKNNNEELLEHSEISKKCSYLSSQIWRTKNYKKFSQNLLSHKKYSFIQILTALSKPKNNQSYRANNPLSAQNKMFATRSPM